MDDAHICIMKRMIIGPGVVVLGTILIKLGDEVRLRVRCTTPITGENVLETTLDDMPMAEKFLQELTDKLNQRGPSQKIKQTMEQDDNKLFPQIGSEAILANNNSRSNSFVFNQPPEESTVKDKDTGRILRGPYDDFLQAYGMAGKSGTVEEEY